MARVYKREPAGSEKGGEFASDDGSIRAHLTMMVGHRRGNLQHAGTDAANRTYISNEEYVLAKGQVFKAPDGLPKGIAKRKMGLCYMNAYQLVDANPGKFTYVEGYATFMHIPMGHAWAVDAKNNVIDPTWAGDKNYNRKDAAYYGVKMKIEDVRKTIFARGKYGVLHNYEQGFPHLK